jgi:hypothetical protein
MYGKAVKCDICNRMEIINDFDMKTTFFDAGFAGWIRMTVNAPRDYGWTFREPKFATTVDSVDCCSLDCARNFLRTVGDTVPADVPAEVQE